MPRLIRRDSDGVRFVLEDDGSMRPAGAEDVGSVVPQHPANEMGVTFGERFTLKNFASTPEVAKQFIRSKGYYVAPFGKGFNFAVQKATSGPDGGFLPPDPNGWKVVDPSGGSDFLFDLADIAAEAGLGFATAAAATAAGAASGGLAAAGGAALAGAGGELLRQGIGSALGIPDNVDLGQAGAVGAVSAAAPIVGKGVGFLAKKAGSVASRVGGELLERFTGIEGQTNFSAAEKMIFAAQNSPKAPLPELSTAAGFFREYVGKVSRPKNFVPAMREAADAVRGVLQKSSGKTVNLRPVLAEIDQIASRREIVFGSQEARLLKIGEEIRTIIGLDAPDQVLRGIATPRDPGRVALQTAHRIKQTLQEIAEDGNAYGLINGDRVIAKTAQDIAKAASNVRRVLINATGGETGTYAKSNRVMEEHFGVLSFFQKAFGEGNPNSPTALMKGVNVVQSIFKGKSDEIHKRLLTMDRLFGTDFRGFLQASANSTVDPGANASIGALLRLRSVKGGDITKLFKASNVQQLFESDSSPLVGRLTPFGQVLGAGLGFSLGGVPGAVAGFGLASPAIASKVVFGGVRAGALLGRGVTAGIPAWARRAAPGTAKGLAFAGAQAGERKFRVSDELIRQVFGEKKVVRQDAKRLELEGRL